MSTYTFTPNAYARKNFNLAATAYTGQGMTPLLQEALGKKNYDDYVVAQDPLCGGKASGSISIICNPGETDPAKMRFASIGTIQKMPPGYKPPPPGTLQHDVSRPPALRFKPKGR